MEHTEIKSGKEILDNFFAKIFDIENVDIKIVNSLATLYSTGQLTEKNVVNELIKLRKSDENEN